MEKKDLAEAKEPRHHPKPHEKKHEKGKPKKEHRPGTGVSIAGNPDELINRLLPDHSDRSVALEEVINEGPEHKQLYSAILLKRTYALVKAIEKQTGGEFSAREGHLLRAGKPHHSETISIAFPAASGPKKELEKVLDILAHAPAHEQVMFNTVLQAIEWALETTTGDNAG